MSFAEKYGPWALVAGASEGIGAAFAEALAARGLSLILVARRTEPLDELAAKLRAKVEVRTVALDLARADLAAALDEATAGLDVGLLVYNAAYSRIAEFLDATLDDHLRTVDVNCRGPVVAAYTLGKKMAARGRGGIVLMASMAASQGSALVASYAATKAFNLVLAEGLWDELAARGVDVLACRAGATRTPNYERSKPAGSVPIQEPAAVAEAALAALGRTPSMVPGFFNGFAAFLMGRLLPRRTAIRIMGKETRKLYAGGR